MLELVLIIHLLQQMEPNLPQGQPKLFQCSCEKPSIHTKTREMQSVQNPAYAAVGPRNVPKDHTATPASRTFSPPILKAISFLSDLLMFPTASIAIQLGLELTYNPKRMKIEQYHVPSHSIPDLEPLE